MRVRAGFFLSLGLIAAALAFPSGSVPARDQGSARVPVRGAARATPARPPGAVEVAPGDDLQRAIDRAPDGGAVALAPGRHEGPIAVTRAVTIWGPPDAVIASRGEGSTIRVEADGTALLGFTVDGSGGRFDLLDAAVHVGAADVRVEGLLVRRALFGILLEKCRGAVVRGNEVRGDGRLALGLRGDAIRLWETNGSLVCGNVVADARDVVVWYSTGNRIAGNAIARGRYGTHFMYAHGNAVEGNLYLENTVGVFVMYSRDVLVRSNLIARSRGAAGMGVGLKESGAVTVTGNLLLDDTTGIYVDTTPMNEGDHLSIEGNDFRTGEVGLAFHSSPKRVSVLRNTFRDQRAGARVDGGGDALGATFRGNDFDDYRGYDMDGDGAGDVPYELRSFSGDLVSRYPDLAFFRGTPVLALADLANHVLPLFRPRTVLVDPAPRMGTLFASDMSEAAPMLAGFRALEGERAPASPLRESGEACR